MSMLGLEGIRETAEMNLGLTPDPHLFTLFREHCPERATSPGLNSPAASAWGILVCLTQRFRCKSHLIITRVRAVAEMLWVKGAPVSRGVLPRCRGRSGRVGAVRGRRGGWAPEAKSEAWGWGKKVGAALLHFSAGVGCGLSQGGPAPPPPPLCSECRQDKMRFVPSPPCRAAAV